MEEYDRAYKIYQKASSVQAAKSHFADEFDVPYSECTASKVGYIGIAVIHNV